MSFRDLFGFALAAVLQNRRRSALSLLGVVIGVVAVLSLTAIGEGALRYIGSPRCAPRFPSRSAPRT